MPPLPRRARIDARLLLTASIGVSFALLGAAACSPAAPTPSAPIGTVSIAAAAPTATLSASAAALPPSTQPTKAEVARLVCGDRPRCEVQRERPAGRDSKGRTLSVIRAYTGLELLDGSAPPTGGDAGPLPLGLEETDLADTLSPPIGMRGCQRFEYWLLVRDDKAPPAATRLLSACNDGHGASGVGEDTITVGDNRLEHAASGGSSWRWDRADVLSLSPLRVRTSSNAGYWTLGPNVAQSTSRWDEFSFDHGWSSPACDPNGEPVEDAGPIGELGADAFAYLPIPAVDLEGDYRTSGWKTAALGACSARVDASGRGDVTEGSAQRAPVSRDATPIGPRRRRAARRCAGYLTGRHRGGTPIRFRARQTPLNLSPAGGRQSRFERAFSFYRHTRYARKPFRGQRLDCHGSVMLRFHHPAREDRGLACVRFGARVLDVSTPDRRRSFL